MLTSDRLRQLLEQDVCCPACPLCCSRKSSCVWKQLPCKHGCCETCLEKWYEARRDEVGGKNEERQPGRQLSCPFCRGCTTLPPEGVKAFPTYSNEGTKDLSDLIEFVKRTQAMSCPQHACALCPYDVGPLSIRLFNYCHQNGLTLCPKCQGRFPTVPSAPPADDVPTCTRWRLNELWTSQPTSGGRYSDAAVVVMNGAFNIVVCDSYKQRLLLFTFRANEGKCILTEKTSFKPFCVAQDDQGMILVTKFNSTTLGYLDSNKLKDMKVSKKVKADQQPQGLARLEGGETVVAEVNKTIAVYDVTAKCVQRWRCDAQPEYVTAKDDVIIASFREDNSIIAFDQTGSRKWKVRLQQPRGVTVDKDRVLVAHEGQNGEGLVRVYNLNTGQMQGQLDLPPVDVHGESRLVKAIPCEGKILLVYNHFIQMTSCQ